MRKRSAYRPRLVRIPTTAGLVTIMRRHMVDCEIAVRLGVASAETFNDLADLFDVIGTLLLERTPEHDADAIALRSGALTLLAAAQRYRADPANHDRAKPIRFSPIDADSLQRGLEVIVRRLGEVSVTDIYMRMQATKAARRCQAPTSEAPHAQA